MPLDKSVFLLALRSRCCIGSRKFRIFPHINPFSSIFPKKQIRRENHIHEGEVVIHEEEVVIHEEEVVIHEEEVVIHEEEVVIHEGEVVIHEGERVIHAKIGSFWG